MARLPRHRSLVAWQRADELFVRLHRLSLQRFPPHERYELGSELRRAAFSVPNNIVEGTERYHPRETLQFLRTSRASLREAANCLHAAHRLGYIDAALKDDLDAQIRQVAAPLSGLIRLYREKSLRRTK